VNPREILIKYPMEDADVLTLFRAAIKASRDAGNNPRLALFDTVSSLPGLRMPFEDLTAICKEEGILSLIDAAHGVGHVHIDLGSLDPDFFVSNCHKWLFLPRGCAVFYVPARNQPLMRSTLPTSHGFVPKDRIIPSPLHTDEKNEFVSQFSYTGTIDNTSYLMVPEAIKWREEVCGGEKAIIEYNTNLTREGGKAVAKILGTEILDNATNTLTKCCLINVLLPLTASPFKTVGTNTVDPKYATEVIEWIQQTVMNEYKSFLPIYYFQDHWWTRLSGQVYLDISDFEWAGNVLKEICERVGNGEFLGST
jgi:selenocysteine lyase/cysteine desulfurase